jgi:glycosyltransferase involved in cell wall biosynthesis
MLIGHVTRSFLLTTSWCLALGWLWQAFAALRGMPGIQDITREEPTASLPGGDSPHLSVVVPACNEEASIQTTLRSLLRSTGVRLQIIAIDDRSNDRTGGLMDEVAAEAAASGCPHSIVVIHNRELPAGWLGKSHALSLGLQKATAPWLLFTDGDAIFATRALELAMHQALAEQADHFVLLATLLTEGASEAVIAATAQALSQWSLRLWKVADPSARDFFGMGCFNLVRRDVFEKLGGIQALRMEIVEDLSLGALVKHAGHRSRVAIGPGLVSIRWIEGVLGLARNCEKNGFAIFRYKVWICVLAGFGIALDVFIPLAAMACGTSGLLSGLLTYLGVSLTIQANHRMNRVSPFAAILFAPAAAIIGYGFMRSMVLTLARDGVNWRGTHYPLSELRKHAISWR